MPDDDSPPRSLKQEDDHEDLQPRAMLTRSRTVSSYVGYIQIHSAFF